ncbi:MAG: acyl-CoA dehydrogenase [Gemmatimonadales bacterium]|nr:acyl-CoA dehydrogenase [Gemmatimonadales bacterium]NIN10824.1 acyl-CoA dehydrogenase [Gemmatimonadales bacterium]NIN49467.1 acyl-CoA dehydrogenase [Gemmatimonadales bacterium]NIP06931.1 acyl-CoA dehydrogenase [Gemmatimonadales bacterium]NIR01607.1 acyl-CoA dehydrogenase [Gemmatimonadales bacterium]
MTIAEPLLQEVDEQRREIVALAREFAQKEIAPRAAEWDRTKQYPAEVMRQLGELGFYGLRIPEEYDGLGLDTLTYMMVLEEIAAADASVSISLSVHNSLPVSMLLAHGTVEQKERWLRPMARGEVLAAFSLSEADSGSDAASLRARAVRDGDAWVLAGEKAWVTNGDTAELLMVMVRTDTPEDWRGRRGISAFLIPAGTPGVEPGKPEDKLGLRASRTTTLMLNDVRLGDEHLLGEEGEGYMYALRALDNGRMGVAAQAVGIARAAFEHARQYSGERQQFERPIKEFQAIQFKLADMVTRITAARTLMYEAARAEDRGDPVAELASMAKLFASETAMWVTTQAVQLFGGYGYMRDYPVERLFRDAKVTEIYEGTSEIQRIVIARGLYSE